MPAHIPVYVVNTELLRAVIGFTFHSGVMAIGRRKPSRDLAAVMDNAPARLTLVICPQIANTENMGALIRIAAAFGAHAMILGPQCCDPFWRQSVRVSMGAIFSLPLVRSNDLLDDLRRLRQQWGVQLAATVLADDAEPLASALAPRPPGPPVRQ